MSTGTDKLLRKLARHIAWQEEERERLEAKGEDLTCAVDMMKSVIDVIEEGHIATIDTMRKRVIWSLSKVQGSNPSQSDYARHEERLYALELTKKWGGFSDE